ncbi:hypothetical protein [Amycolatopsis sp. NPDC003731]
MRRKSYEAGKAWEIRVRNFADGAWLCTYTGPWTDKAERQWTSAGKHFARRVRRHVSDREVMAFFYGHPDMGPLERFLDALYVIPGDPNDPPNRTGAQ